MSLVSPEYLVWTVVSHLLAFASHCDRKVGLSYICGYFSVILRLFLTVVMGIPCGFLTFPVLMFLFQFALCDGRLVLPNLGVREWKSHDVALKTRLQPIHSALSADAISPSEAAGEFSASVADFLGSIGVFKGGGGGYGGERGGDTDISDEAFLAAKREK